MNISTQDFTKALPIPPINQPQRTEQPSAFSAASRWQDSIDSGDITAAWENLFHIARMTLAAEKEVQH